LQEKRKCKLIPDRPIAKSSVRVQISADAITIHALEADIQLLPNGALTVFLQRGVTKVSLDAEWLDSAQSISLPGKNHPGVILDLATAEVNDAAGKLGHLGKQINIPGKSPGTDVEEAATLEVWLSPTRLTFNSQCPARSSIVGRPLELCGFDTKSYDVANQTNHKDPGTMVGPVARIKVEF
jgi:hypothetical protein